MGTQKCPHPNTLHHECATLHGKRGFAGVIKLRVLRWEDDPEFSGWGPYWKAGGSQSETEM